VKRSFLKSHQSILKFRPLIVGTLTNGSSLAAQLKLARSSNIDLIELRLDGFPKAYGAFQKAYDFGRAVIREIKIRTKLPVLLTFRADDERGRKIERETIDDKRRAEILARLLPSVDMVDVEIRHLNFAKRMTVVAHIHGVDVVHSVHDFKGPGNFKVLETWARRSNDLKGDLFKAVVSPRMNDDLERFLNWGMTLSNPRKILIGMGSVGVVSRVVGYSFGSLFSFGHLGKSAAPGQMAAKDLAASVHHVYRRD